MRPPLRLQGSGRQRNSVVLAGPMLVQAAIDGNTIKLVVPVPASGAPGIDACTPRFSRRAFPCPKTGSEG
jgi:hypothetical protein